MPPIGPIPSPRSEKPAEAGERLAINLFDLDRVPRPLYEKLLAGRLEMSKEKLVQVDPDRPDETGVVFTCGTLAAATACDIVRMDNAKEGTVPVRLYINRGKSWSRLASTARLTLVASGRPCLNPEVFPSVVRAAPLQAPLVKKVF